MFYAASFKDTYTIHVFATRPERDAWVNDEWATRETTTAKMAKGYARATKHAYIHGDAYLPKSWARVWNVSQTCNPDVYYCAC